jgi:pyruvate dehydrogenase E1 component alpha subunit
MLAGRSIEGGRAMALDKAQLTRMLRTMILIREFDELAIQLRVAGKIYGAVHPYVGQEAVAVGVCANLGTRDRVTSTHRGHGHCIAKGADIRRMMAELFGRVDGYCKGKGGSMHIADFAVGMLGANGIVGGGLPIACGAALAAQLEGQGAVTVCFFGDGAAAEGEFHEALNIASLWKLPIVFVCENNQYAANNAVAVQHPGIDLVAHAGAYSMPGVAVDGNDVLAVHGATGDAVARARRGDGPSLLEGKTYRWRFHAMRAAVPAETRPAAEIASWKARDPIACFEHEVLERGTLSAFEIRSLREGVKADLEEAVAFAENSPFPDPKDLLVDMFAEPATRSA